MEFLWAVPSPPTKHRSPPNEVKGRGDGLFDDIIPTHTCLHFRGIPMRHALRFKGVGRMCAAVSHKAEALPEGGGRVHKVHAHYQIVNTTFRKMDNSCYQEYRGKCVRHPHTADINRGLSTALPRDPNRRGFCTSDTRCTVNIKNLMQYQITWDCSHNPWRIC